MSDLTRTNLRLHTATAWSQLLRREVRELERRALRLRERDPDDPAWRGPLLAAVALLPREALARSRLREWFAEGLLFRHRNVLEGLKYFWGSRQQGARDAFDLVIEAAVAESNKAAALVPSGLSDDDFTREEARRKKGIQRLKTRGEWPIEPTPCSRHAHKTVVVHVRRRT